MITLELGEPLIHLTSVDSTNNYATLLLQQEKIMEGTVILADYQSQGKGQAGNQWISDKESNLLFSIVLKPVFLPAERQFYLSMCISNGLSEFVSSIAGSATIKWPNDILVEGKKIAGILIENTIMGNMLNTCITGIGINVNQHEFPAGLENATSLAMITGKSYLLHALLSDLLKFLSSSVNNLYNGRLAIIRTNYLNNLQGLNQWAGYADSNGSFEGRITDVADSGELIILDREGKLRQYAFKEILFGKDL
jgi:BirA family biotin operon repressor/biotin-[acetyl-CoA-carboxylase] ligase